MYIIGFVFERCITRYNFCSNIIVHIFLVKFMKKKNHNNMTRARGVVVESLATQGIRAQLVFSPIIFLTMVFILSAQGFAQFISYEVIIRIKYQHFFLSFRGALFFSNKGKKYKNLLTCKVEKLKTFSSSVINLTLSVSFRLVPFRRPVLDRPTHHTPSRSSSQSPLHLRPINLLLTSHHHSSSSPLFPPSAIPSLSTFVRWSRRNPPSRIKPGRSPPAARPPWRASRGRSTSSSPSSASRRATRAPSPAAPGAARAPSSPPPTLATTRCLSVPPDPLDFVWIFGDSLCSRRILRDFVCVCVSGHCWGRWGVHGRLREGHERLLRRRQDLDGCKFRGLKCPLASQQFGSHDDVLLVCCCCAFPVTPNVCDSSTLRLLSFQEVCSITVHELVEALWALILIREQENAA